MVIKTNFLTGNFMRNLVMALRNDEPVETFLNNGLGLFAFLSFYIYSNRVLLIFYNSSNKFFSLCLSVINY